MLRSCIRCAGYPRRTVRVDVQHVRRNASAISRRAELDKVIILRAGKARWVLVRHDYFADTERRAFNRAPSALIMRGPPQRIGRR